ncbi:MAG: cysteine desulfurase family protein [Pirellulaceae bacterium]
MVQTPVYVDNQATTRLDPRVLNEMLPFFCETYGNAGSTSHVFGWDAQEAVDRARQEIAAGIGARSREIVFTSGATEANNLALRGVAERNRRKGNHMVSVATEHKSVLDPLKRLSRRGYEITLLPVRQSGSDRGGLLTAEDVAAALRDDTILVSVMLANNETGAIQPLAHIGEVCKSRSILLHADATQAVGKIPVNVEELRVDLMSFSAHKLYGPKGIGSLYVRRRQPNVRLDPQIDGGGQEGGLRSGTLNVPGIIGFAAAIRFCLQEMPTETDRLRELRARLWRGLSTRIPDVTLNGPALEEPSIRLAGNLNCSFAGVDGEALMMSMRDVAASSGSACTSANPEPSHVLRAMGLSDDSTRASLRFGLGRFNTVDDVDLVVSAVADAVERLRSMRGSAS